MSDNTLTSSHVSPEGLQLDAACNIVSTSVGEIRIFLGAACSPPEFVPGLSLLGVHLMPDQNHIPMTLDPSRPHFSLFVTVRMAGTEVGGVLNLSAVDSVCNPAHPETVWRFEPAVNSYDICGKVWAYVRHQENGTIHLHIVNNPEDQSIASSLSVGTPANQSWTIGELDITMIDPKAML